MTIILIIKLVLIDIKRYCQKIYYCARLKSNNPTCEISTRSLVSKNNTIGKCVAIFDNVVVDNTTIGNYTYIQANSRIFNAEIGKFCSIGSLVTIAPGEHNYKNVSTHPAMFHSDTPLPMVFVSEDFKSSEPRKAIIGNDVWIGEKVIVLNGISVGDGAVIAAAAVVTHDVEPYQIVAGVPAKPIGYRFDENTRHQIHQSKWWNKDIEWLKNNSYLFNNIPDFIANANN